MFGVNLRKQKSRSCGCLKKEVARVNGSLVRTHGLTNSSEFRIWTGIKTRCYNPNACEYKNYGGRGIVMAEAWRRSFASFYADLGPRPSMDHEVERIDNDGPYSSGNCRWAPYWEQSQNTRRTVRLSFAGETLRLKEWSERLSIRVDTLRARIDRGWDVERVLMSPLGKSRFHG